MRRTRFASSAVGPHSRTVSRSSLFLDSYDPTQDDAESNILARILGAVVPVCEGINLTYFFSYIDSSGWGCGTKLPHNVTVAVGSDGWRVERPATGPALARGRNPRAAAAAVRRRNDREGHPRHHGAQRTGAADYLQRLGAVGRCSIRNSSRIQVFRQNQFHVYQPETTELPKVPSSVDWYRGSREHLEFAVIEPG